mmetsp:Transcript_118364/g.382125  ORF Transcript_118364/g.382125 Transcript_118364/m.382125 type:complete len:412 (+) Transcript_118364:467-1702(+)
MSCCSCSGASSAAPPPRPSASPGTGATASTAALTSAHCCRPPMASSSFSLQPSPPACLEDSSHAARTAARAPVTPATTWALASCCRRALICPSPRLRRSSRWPSTPLGRPAAALRAVLTGRLCLTGLRPTSSKAAHAAAGSPRWSRSHTAVVVARAPPSSANSSLTRCCRGCRTPAAARGGPMDAAAVRGNGACELAGHCELLVLAAPWELAVHCELLTLVTPCELGSPSEPSRPCELVSSCELGVSCEADTSGAVAVPARRVERAASPTEPETMEAKEASEGCLASEAGGPRFTRAPLASRLPEGASAWPGASASASQRPLSSRKRAMSLFVRSSFSLGSLLGRRDICLRLPCSSTLSLSCDRDVMPAWWSCALSTRALRSRSLPAMSLRCARSDQHASSELIHRGSVEM